MKLTRLTKKSRGMLFILAAAIILVGVALFLWSQRSNTVKTAVGPLTVTAFPGTLQLATAHVAVPSQINGATFAVTGDLRDILEPALSNGQAIEPGDVALPVAVGVPSNKTDGTFKGAVEVRENGKSVASTQVTVVVQKPSANYIPAGTAQPTGDRIATLADAPMQYVKDELLVTVASNIQDPNPLIKDVAAKTQGKIIGKLANNRTFQLRYDVTDMADLIKKQNDITWIIGVDAATFNVIGQSEAITNDSDLNDPQKPGDPWKDATASDRTWGQRYIGLPQAWDKTTGNKSVKVGIIDGGFDLNHPDLKANIAPQFSTSNDWYTNWALTEDRTPHGTVVAGTACAVGNNGIGVTGVMWQCSLGLYNASTYYPINLHFGFTDISKGYHYTNANIMNEMKQAAKDGMRVANMSIGAGIWNGTCNAPLSASTKVLVKSMKDNLATAVKDVQNAKQDVLWVIAAGNECRDMSESAPASLVSDFPDNIMAVAAISKTQDMQQDATRLPRSNWGDDISVAAPGDGIWSTTAKTATAPNSAYYKPESGTSLAAPFVTGLAGLVLLQHSDFTAKQVKQCIVDAAKNGGHRVQGYSFYVINAPKTLDCQPDPDPNSPRGTAQQCVFNMTLLPTKCSSTNPTVKVEFTNVAGSAVCVNDSHLDWGDGQKQDNVFKNIEVDKTVPIATHSFSQPGKHFITDSFVPKTGGPCTILEQGYDFTLLTGKEPADEDPF